KATPGIIDVQTSVGDPRPEYRIRVDRNLANELGLSVAQVAGTVRPVLAGQDVTRWEDPTGEERDVVVQVAPEQRMSLENIETLPIATPLRAESGMPVTVPLGQIASIERGEAPSQIDRNNLSRIITVSAGMTTDLSVSEA